MPSDKVSGLIFAERIRVLYRQMPVALLVNLVNSVLTAIVLDWRMARPFLLGWLVFVALVTAGRAILWFRYTHAPAPVAGSRRWAAFAMAGSVLAGLSWGGGGLLMYSDSMAERLFLAFVIGGMCVGAVGASFAHLPTMLAFILPAGLLFAIRFLVDGSALPLVMGLMILIFVTALSVIGRNLNASLNETLVLRFKLAERTNALDEAYRRLQREMVERRSTEEALHQSQKLHALGHLTAGVAHDFNNLLTVILGNLDLLGAHVTNEAGKRLMAAARHGAERGARLVDSLLAFGRRQPLRPQRVDINLQIQEFGDMLRRAAGHAVEIRFQLAPEPALSWIDPAQLQAALVNLVVNARDAVKDVAGRIVIESTNTVVEAGEVEGGEEGAGRGGAYVVVTVSDNGTGMAPEVQRRAFEPFFTTKPAGEGSGLGLSQVYGFVCQSGGHVELVSAPGMGTTVRLYLPRSGEREGMEGKAPAVPELSEERATDTGSETVLVVEDDPDVRMVAAAELRRLGYRVLAAGDGPAALRLLEREGAVDLLFADIVTPRGMGGLEFLRRAGAVCPKVKVLLTTGVPDAAPETKYPLLLKPYHQRELARAVRAALDCGRAAAGSRSHAG